MKSSQTDLFPETLIVTMIDGRPMTTSLLIAQHFGKRHDTVLRAIKILIGRTTDARRLRNFAESSYLNEQGKRQPKYLLNRDGFFFVVGGFTGPQADAWKWEFIDAFNAMEAQLSAQRDRYVAALDQIRPNLRPVVQDFQAGLSRLHTADLLDKSCAAITYHRRSARRLGLL